MERQATQAVRADQTIESIETAPTQTTTYPTTHMSGGEATTERAILSIRGRVPHEQAAAFISEALRNIRAHMQEHDIKPAGAPFTVCQPKGDGEVDVEAGWPLANHAAGTPQIHCGDLPSSYLPHTHAPRELEYVG